MGIGQKSTYKGVKTRSKIYFQLSESTWANFELLKFQNRARTSKKFDFHLFPNLEQNTLK